MPVRGGLDTPLVGRHAEVASLEAILDLAVAGDGRTVVIEGEAGIGKSRLLQDLVVGAFDRGFGVLDGEAEELEQTRPFGPLIKALEIAPTSPDSALARIGRMLSATVGQPGPVEPVRSDVRFQVVDEIVAVLQDRTSTAPLVVALEDVQWADSSTLLTVWALARRVAHLPVVLMLTLRPTPRSKELNGVLDRLSAIGAVHMGLEPLAAEAVAELVASAVQASPGPRLLAEALRGGGNPLWTRELVNAFSSEGWIEIADGQAEIGHSDLPPSLRLTILRRLRYLSQEALDLLRIAALLGSTFGLEDLSLCLRRPVLDMLPVLDEVMSAGILAGAGHRLAFRHDLLWEVIYQDLPPAVRRGVHLEVGRALARAGRPSSQVAIHLSRGASPGDAEAVEWLQRAAREAAPASPNVAAELLERAGELLDAADPRHDEVVAELVAALVRSGRAAEAEAIARESLKQKGGVDVGGSLRWGLAEALQMQGKLGDALEQVEAAASASDLPEWRQARLLADAAQWRYYTGDPAGARAAADTAIALGERFDDDLAVCLGLSALSRVAVDELDLGGGISLSRQAVARAADSPSARSTDFIHPSFDLAGALVIADQLAEAEEVLRGGRRLRESLGSTWDRPLFTNALAHVQLYRGDWDDAVAEANTVLAMVDEGAAKGSLLWTYSLLAFVAVHRGDLDAAGEIQEAAQMSEGGRPRTMGSDLLLWCQALAHEARGALGEAADRLDEAWDLALPFKIVTWPRMAADTVRVAVAIDRRPRAEAVTAAMDDIGRRTKVPLYQGTALRCHGMYSGDVEALTEAVETLGRAERPMEVAAAREDAGRLLASLGREVDAVQHLDTARATYEQLGATWDMARTEAALRALGVRRSRRSPRPRPKTGWDSLTRTEHKVLRLAATGLTNGEIGSRLYISPRTVETHLSHLYRKLGVRSRTQLAAAAAARPP